MAGAAATQATVIRNISTSTARMTTVVFVAEPEPPVQLMVTAMYVVPTPPSLRPMTAKR